MSEASPPRTPVRPLALGGPHRGPVLMWTERGARIGAEPPAPDVWDRWLPRLGPVFQWIWRLLGLLAWPVLLAIPRARRFLWRIPAPEPGWIWLHGASAGEHVAARALAAALPPEVWRTSSSWRTPVAGASPAPLDLPFLVARWLDRARPRMLVLVEAELWPGWLHACRVRGIPVVVVNARAGRGTSRLRRWRPVWRWISQGVRFIGQEQTGDLKLSTEIRAATFSIGREAFVAASTRSGDEARLLAAWALLPSPRPLLVLAPRHLDRVPELLVLLKRVSFVRRTQGLGLLGPETEVLLLDTLGELASLFPQARAAFVGGTFDVAIGGHSPAEAFAAGLPVVHGPHTHANPLAWTQGIALRVGADSPSALASAIRSALGVGPRQAQRNDAALRAAGLLPDGHTPDETPARPWLAPLVPLWRAAVHAAPSTRQPPVRVGVPVISVGALVAGGAGKTPAVGWLAERLEGAWVVARGYGRRHGGDVRVGLPGEAGGAEELGDELEMLRRRGIPVVSAPDRVAGAREAEARGARWILLDDGFQHRRLHRDLDVVCIDARWPDGRGPIPVGTRREPWSALARAHHLWISHPDRPGSPPGAPALPPRLAALAVALPQVVARMGAVGWLRGGVLHPLSAVAGPVDVVVGVARPEGFVCVLLTLGLEIRSLRVTRDHAPLRALPPGAVLTEKDAARLPPDADVWALVMDLRLTGEDRLLAAIQALPR